MNFLKRFGEYPPEYKPNVHGSYDPARWYGKPDTPFGEVKISELPSWFGRRNMSPVAITQACGRAYWRWNHRYWLAKKTTPSGIYQALVMSMLLFYAMNSNRLGEHARAKYH